MLYIYSSIKNNVTTLFMKKLKPVFYSILLVMAIFSTVTYTACNKDLCEGKICQNGGSCTDGKCTCPTGYTGTNCETKSDPCKDITCQNGGTCTDGKCNCPAGYTGTYCEQQLPVAHLIKTWIALDVQGSADTLPLYSCIIAKGTGNNDVVFIKFPDDCFANNVIGTTSGYTLTIPLQDPDNDGYKVSGTGTYDEATKKISWTYEISNSLGVSVKHTGLWY
jgi:hypothetical protein